MTNPWIQASLRRGPHLGQSGSLAKGSSVQPSASTAPCSQGSGWAGPAACSLPHMPLLTLPLFPTSPASLLHWAAFAVLLHSSFFATLLLKGKLPYASLLRQIVTAYPVTAKPGRQQKGNIIYWIRVRSLQQTVSANYRALHYSDTRAISFFLSLSFSTVNWRKQ